MPHLEIDRLSVGYGGANVLHDITLDVRPGEVVTILGANGAGKTSLLYAIMGIVPRRAEAVRLDQRREPLVKFPLAMEVGPGHGVCARRIV